MHFVKKKPEEKRKEFVVRDIITYKEPKSGSEITVIPSSEYQITTMVDFGTKILGTQNATMNSIKNFKDDISNSRTFSFLHEIEMLLNKGLIKGGDLNNAIVYVDKPLSDSTMKKLKKAFNKDDIKLIDDKAKKVISDFKSQFIKIDQPSREVLESIVNELIESHNTNFKGVGQPLRIALTGSKFGPGIYDIILSLGKEEVDKRLANKILA